MAETPMVLILVGLVAYTVLAGADFGAGFWTLFAGGGRAGATATRDHARHAMGPVWEANHVWLVFVLVVCWTAYPVAYASLVSSLAAPLFITAVGIIARGSTYALRSQLRGPHRTVEQLFGISSILTPFALGTVAGAIASGRVPVGNAAADHLRSWLNPTSLVVGLLAIAISTYLAAVYLAADARRLREPELADDFRHRALWSGVVAGALAVAGLMVVRVDARPIWDGLTRGWGLAMLVASATAGLLTLLLVWRRHFGPARASAAAAVATVVAGWAAAQHPFFLPGLTVAQAAAGRPVLVAVIVAVALGAVVLVPALVLLFGLFLGGRLDQGRPSARPTLLVLTARRRAGSRRLLGVFAAVSLVVGVGLMLLTEPGVTFVVGVVAMIAGAASTFVLATADDA